MTTAVIHPVATQLPAAGTLVMTNQGLALWDGDAWVRPVASRYPQYPTVLVPCDNVVWWYPLDADDSDVVSDETCWKLI